METIKERGFQHWMAPCIITITIVMSVFGFFLWKDLSATIKTNRLQVGDVFSVRVRNDNPYRNDILFSGVIISKSGDYIQYIEPDGDTSSTNIRDAYRFPKTFEVVVYDKQKEKAAE